MLIVCREMFPKSDPVNRACSVVLASRMLPAPGCVVSVLGGIFVHGYSCSFLSINQHSAPQRSLVVYFLLCRCHVSIWNVSCLNLLAFQSVGRKLLGC